MARKTFLNFMKLVLAAFALVAAAETAGAQACADRGSLTDRLANVFHEKLFAYGVMGGFAIMEVYVSETGTWTVVVTDTAGWSCIVAAGEGWEPLMAAIGEEA